MKRKLRLLPRGRQPRCQNEHRTLRAAGLGLMIAATVEAAGMFGNRQYEGSFSLVQSHHGLGAVAGILVAALTYWLTPNP